MSQSFFLPLFSCLQYGYEGRVPMKSARLFYNISERARHITESYFLLNSTLHFSYTHLVCRTAITGHSHSDTHELSFHLGPILIMTSLTRLTTKLDKRNVPAILDGSHTI